MWSNPKLRGVTSPSLAAHSCAVIGSKLYMFGGLTPAGAASDELYSLDTGNDFFRLLVYYMHMFMWLISIHVVFGCECAHVAVELSIYKATVHSSTTI